LPWVEDTPRARMLSRVGAAEAALYRDDPGDLGDPGGRGEDRGLFERLKKAAQEAIPRGALILGVLAVVNAGSGFLARKVVGHVFGASPETDALWNALKLTQGPVDILITGGIIGPFLPLFLGLKGEAEATARTFARTILTSALLVMAAAIAVVIGLFAELALFGGDRTEVALLFAGLQSLTLCALLLLARWARLALSTRALVPIVILYGAAMLWGAVQLAPFPTGIAKEAWAAAGATPSITLDRFSTTVEILKLAGLGSVFLIGVALGRDDDRARNSLRAFGVLASIYAIFAILSFELFHNGPFVGPSASGARLNATLLSPNVAATVLGIFAVLSWTAILRALQSSQSADDLPMDQLRDLLRIALPWTPPFVLCLWALALTGSRGGGLAACLGLATASVAMAAGGFKRRRRLRFALFVGAASLAALGALGAILLGSGPIAERMSFAADGLADRAQIHQIYLERLGQLPWTGYGLGAFRHFNSLFTAPGPTAGLWNLGAMHEVYLQWIYEAGWPGAMLMFSAIGAVMVVIAGGLTRRHFGRTWMVGALGASATVLAHGFVDFALELPAIAAIWALILGLGVGVSRPAL